MIMPMSMLPVGSRCRSIRFWLGWLVVACAVPAWLVATFLIFDSYEKARADAKSNAVVTTRALMQAVDAGLQGVQSSLQILAASPFLRSGDLASFYRVAEDALRLLPGNAIALVDPTGRLLINTNIPYGETLPQTAIPDVVRAVFNSSGPVISDFFVGATTGLPQTAIGVPVLRGGQIVYALVIGMTPDTLAEILERQKVPESWTVAILDSAGTIVGQTKNSGRFVGGMGTPEFRRLTSTADELMYRLVSLEGDAVIGGFSRSPATGWMVAMGVPETSIMLDARRALMVNILTAGVFLLLGTLMARAINARIGGSIRRMVAPAQAIGLSEKVDIPAVAIQEVDELGQALTRASELIEQRERQRDEAERRRVQIEARLQQSRKLAALGQAAGTAAHDLGNLLQPIALCLHQLQENPAHPRSKIRLKLAVAAAERGRRVVRALMAFASLQPLTITAVDVNSVLQSMEDLLKQPLASRATLILELAPEVWPSQGDVDQLERAVLNLIVNARDAMTAQGTVRISTANVTLNGEHDELMGDYVAIAVSDTGSGMPPEVLSRAFEPLFTTKEPGKGTGLGLASTYGFAKQCGGGAEIHSAVGKGTTVTIYLPRSRAGTG